MLAYVRLNGWTYINQSYNYYAQVIIIMLIIIFERWPPATNNISVVTCIGLNTGGCTDLRRHEMSICPFIFTSHSGNTSSPHYK